MELNVCYQLANIINIPIIINKVIQCTLMLLVIFIKKYYIQFHN